MFKKTWQSWKRLNSKILDKEATIILFLLYWILFTPIAAIFNIFSDPLNLKSDKKSFWFEKDTGNVSTRKSLKKQY